MTRFNDQELENITSILKTISIANAIPFLAEKVLDQNYNAGVQYLIDSEFCTVLRMFHDEFEECRDDTEDEEDDLIDFGELENNHQHNDSEVQPPHQGEATPPIESPHHHDASDSQKPTESTRANFTEQDQNAPTRSEPLPNLPVTFATAEQLSAFGELIRINEVRSDENPPVFLCEFSDRRIEWIPDDSDFFLIKKHKQKLRQFLNLINNVTIPVLLGKPIN